MMNRTAAILLLSLVTVGCAVHRDPRGVFHGFDNGWEDRFRHEARADRWVNR